MINDPASRTGGTRSRPPAVLIVNPNAGRIGDADRADVIRALRSRFELDAYATTARDTGIVLAADAAGAGAELVIAFGGDGHVNEVANGLAKTSSALGVIPGGTMNVFARALEVPLDPFAAIDHLQAVLERPARTVPLGKMDERYFTFSAGCGFDAEAAERVERYVPAKRRFGELFFYWSAFRVLAGSYRHRAPTMLLKGEFGEVPVSMAIASNAGPYAYLAGMEIKLAPEVSLMGGIDVFALKTMRIEALPQYAWRSVVSKDFVNHPDCFYRSDLESFELHSEGPFARHVDGEPLAPAHSARFAIEPEALRVRA
ncbi:MAG TPA: diacylglycerol kinase family protein [Actinomycetota bacterium]|jgi:diacylglycerol kinase family enzyme